MSKQWFISINSFTLPISKIAFFWYYFRKNFLKMNMYFESLIYEEIKESPSVEVGKCLYYLWIPCFNRIHTKRKERKAMKDLRIDNGGRISPSRDYQYKL